MNSEFIYDNLVKMFPDAHCELNHDNNYQMMIAVILSAQTTDAKVNKVTPQLFLKYPDFLSLSRAKNEDIEELIKSLGLYRNKAKNIIKLANEIIERYQGNIPDNLNDLTSLSGIGRKSANVILSECFNYPAIAVDTHVERVSKRLKLANETDSVLAVELKLQKTFKKENWSYLHHLLIFFGRYHCHAKNPKCLDCPFKRNCREYNESDVNK